MLIKSEQSLLLIIDLQERLAPAIHEMESILKHNLWLADIANKLEIPVFSTLQYPAGLGPMLPELAQRVQADKVFEKIAFSVLADPLLDDAPEFKRRQIILTGTETHVCVLQTALDLLALGKEVFVVAEAVGSRYPADRDLALTRMRTAGCHIVSREMVVFEWLRRAGTPLFKAVSREFLRG